MKVGSLLLLATGFAIAQPAFSQISVYVDLSAAKLTGNSPRFVAPTQTTDVLYGTTVGITKAFLATHHMQLAGDVRGTFVGSGQRMDGIVVGPRFAVRVKKFSPYVEGMVGFARYNDGLNNKASATTDAQTQANFGIDYKVTKHFDWRAFEFGYSQFYGNGGNYNPKTFSTGVVFRIGG